MTRTLETMRAHQRKHLGSEKSKGTPKKVKFSRAMWDRLLRDQHEYAALRKMPLGYA